MDADKNLDYGSWWDGGGGGPDWYRSIFAPREKAHRFFADWAGAIQPPPQSVLEVGCGCAFHYPDVFSDKRYVGVDVSHAAIAWSRMRGTGLGRTNHEYRAGEIEKIDLTEEFDLVFSHAVIDHVKDPDDFISELASYVAPGGHLYVSAYRGWFPHLPGHVIEWSPAYSCYFNDTSQAKLRTALEESGMVDIEFIQVPVDNGEIKAETTIVGRMPGSRLASSLG